MDALDFIIALIFFIVAATPLFAGYILYKRNKAKKVKENTTYVPYREVSGREIVAKPVARNGGRVGQISRKYPGWRPARTFKTTPTTRTQQSVERSSNGFGDALLGLAAGYALGSSGGHSSDSSPSSSEPSFTGGGGSSDGSGASSSWGESSSSSSSSSDSSSSSSSDSGSSDSGGGSSE